MLEHFINHTTLIHFSNIIVNCDQLCCAVVKWVIDINFKKYPKIFKQHLSVQMKETNKKKLSL